MKKSITNFNVDKVPKLLNSLTSILQESLPKSLYGLLSTAVETDQGILVADRWLLKPIAKAHYNIIDTHTGNEHYSEIARLQTAISMINLLSKNPYFHIERLQTLKLVDQAYYRCLVDVAFYKNKVKSTKDYDKAMTMQFRLADKLYKLAEIKQQLFKLYC